MSTCQQAADEVGLLRGHPLPYAQRAGQIAVEAKDGSVEMHLQVAWRTARKGGKRTASAAPNHLSFSQQRLM